MKKLLSIVLLATASLQINAQNKEPQEFRFKTNPLSPMIAYEPNVNLSLEYYKPNEKNRSGIQISLAYIYDWKLLKKSTLNPSLDISGKILTGEYRLYKNSFYFGPYMQYKTVMANNYLRITNNTTENLNLFKKTLSAGFLGGYQFKVSNTISSEVQLNFGMSNKQFYENDIPKDNFEDASDGSFFLIDQTARVPQFLFTYKIVYSFR